MPTTRYPNLDTLAERFGDGSTTASPRVMRARVMAAARRLRDGATDRLKRGLDVAAALVLLILLLPVFLLIALLAKLDDGGPVLFWQRRVGRHGDEFAFPKFRSMRTDAECVKASLADLNDHGTGQVTFKMRKDPRITRIGAVLRKFSLDELPQLWCVLAGDMSLVGPRPPVPGEVDRYKVRHRRRLGVTPGLTCIWQVSGRSDIPFEQQVHLDVDYINRRSFWLDLTLLLRTIPALLTGRGAY